MNWASASSSSTARTWKRVPNRGLEPRKFSLLRGLWGPIIIKKTKPPAGPSEPHREFFFGLALLLFAPVVRSERRGGQPFLVVEIAVRVVRPRVAHRDGLGHLVARD